MLRKIQKYYNCKQLISKKITKGVGLVKRNNKK